MLILPAIDLVGGKAVRLYQGDYAKMTVYNDDPTEVACDFEKQGAKWVHLVDLEGAKNGQTPNLETVRAITAKTCLCAEIGGGIRSMETIEKYLSVGVSRVILGTAAVTAKGFVETAVKAYGEKIAVGVDIRDGQVAIKGWTECAGLDAMDFCKSMQQIGVRTLICTDITKDGAMRGTNHELYKALSKELDMQIIASGGVSSLEDVKRLRALNLYGAIIGKAYYTGAICLKDAMEAAL